MMYVVFGLGMYLAVKIMSPILKFRIFVNLCLEIVIGGSFFLLCCMIYWKITKSPIYEIFSSKISRFHLNKKLIPYRIANCNKGRCVERGRYNLKKEITILI